MNTTMQLDLFTHPTPDEPDDFGEWMRQLPPAPFDTSTLTLSRAGRRVLGQVAPGEPARENHPGSPVESNRPSTHNGSPRRRK